MAVFKCSYVFQDADGTRQSEVIHVPRGTLTLAQITGFMEAQAVLIDNITDAQIVGMGIEIGVTLPVALKDQPVANSECEKGGLFTFACTGTEYAHSIRIPAVTPTLFVGNQVNVGGQSMIDFIASMTAGLAAGGATSLPSNPYEQDIVGFLRAKKSFRK